MLSSKEVVDKSILTNVAQLVHDIAGVSIQTFDPFKTIEYGPWFEMALSGKTEIRYIGEIYQLRRIKNQADSLNQLLRAAYSDSTLARRLSAAIIRLNIAMHWLPNVGNEHVLNIKTSLKHAVKRLGLASHIRLPDISGRFTFDTNLRGSRLTISASGRLGVPGCVKDHRDSSRPAQRRLSSQSGDDAGHLIANQFGARGDEYFVGGRTPGREKNLALQNRVMNRSGGSWHDLEMDLAAKLKKGIGITVNISETFKGETSIRPYHRRIEWSELSTKGERTTGHGKNLSFGNFDSPSRRNARKPKI